MGGNVTWKLPSSISAEVHTHFQTYKSDAHPVFGCVTGHKAGTVIFGPFVNVTRGPKTHTKKRGPQRSAESDCVGMSRTLSEQLLLKNN